MAIPDFSYVDPGENQPTDWNDLAGLIGKHNVKTQLLEVKVKVNPLDPLISGVQSTRDPLETHSKSTRRQGCLLERNSKGEQTRVIESQAAGASSSGYEWEGEPVRVDQVIDLTILSSGSSGFLENSSQNFSQHTITCGECVFSNLNILPQKKLYWGYSLNSSPFITLTCGSELRGLVGLLALSDHLSRTPPVNGHNLSKFRQIVPQIQDRPSYLNKTMSITCSTKPSRI